MPLTNEDFSRIESWLSEKVTNVECNRCGTRNDWTVENELVLLNVAYPQMAMQAAAMFCNNCGHVDLFSTQGMGLGS